MKPSLGPDDAHFFHINDKWHNYVNYKDQFENLNDIYNYRQVWMSSIF